MPQAVAPETLVYGLKSAGDPQISPDGTRILYTLTTADKETKKSSSQLWVCNLDGADARQLTFSGERNNGGKWSPDGAQIAFISDRVGKPARSGIFVLPASGPGEARELTKHNQGIGYFAWSPDGSKIVYTTSFDPENPDEAERKPDEPAPVRVTSRLDYKQDGRGYLGDARNQVWVVDVASGERRRITSEPEDHSNPQWSPDGQTLATRIGGVNGSRFVLLDVATGAEKQVGPDDSNVGVWSFSPNGDRIIFTSDPEHTYQSDFYVYNVASAEIRRLTDDLPVVPAGGRPGVAAPSQPVWLDERQVLFAAERAGGSGLYVIDAESGAMETQQTWQAVRSGFSVDRDKRYVVQGHASFDAVGELSVYDTQSGTSSQISNNNTALLVEIGTPEWERFEVQRGKYAIEAWLLKPVDFDPAKKYPVIMDIHGGPNGHHGYNFNPRHQVYVRNGFVVVFANPRGSNSYGREFTMQVFSDWGGEDFKDLMAVMDKTCELPYVDPERTAIYGYSYGGYMTSWIIGQTQRFKACVCGAPCFDLESFFGTSDIGFRFGERQFGSQPHEGREWYAAHSPSSFAHRATTPTMIIQGEADHRCPVGQGEQMFVALKKAGCEVEFVRYPGMAHGFSSGGPAVYREDVIARSLKWYKDHLGEPA